MSNIFLNHTALNECLEALRHLFIDIARLKNEPAYEEKRGGYCDLQVATLDHDIPYASKLVAAKKLLLATRSSEPKKLAFRLARELKVWAGLRHPHVLPLLGFYVGDNFKTAVLISEYMVHGDLKDYITKMDPDYKERLSLVRDLTDGLAYLHTQDPPVRHGDLKPGNVLVNAQRRALLADFGLSKALGDPTGFTTGNDARCTVRFSSPEVFLQEVATQSLENDIWSWGCLILEAMTNRVPFAEIQPEFKIILALGQGQKPCNLKSLEAELPQFKKLLLKCWSSQPEDRPTAVDCLRAVQSARLSLPPGQSPSQQVPATPWVLSTPPNQMSQSSLQVKRRPRPLIPMEFREFFTTAFNGWLAQRRLSSDPLHMSGRKVKIYKVLFIVGALGGVVLFLRRRWTATVIQTRTRRSAIPNLQ